MPLAVFLRMTDPMEVCLCVGPPTGRIINNGSISADRPRPNSGQCLAMAALIEPGRRGWGGWRGWRLAKGHAKGRFNDHTANDMLPLDMVARMGALRTCLPPLRKP